MRFFKYMLKYTICIPLLIITLCVGCAHKGITRYGSFCGDMTDFVRKNHVISTKLKDMPYGAKHWLDKSHHIKLITDSTAIDKTHSYFIGMGKNQYTKKGFIVLKSVDMDSVPF